MLGETTVGSKPGTGTRKEAAETVVRQFIREQKTFVSQRRCTNRGQSFRVRPTVTRAFLESDCVKGGQQNHKKENLQKGKGAVTTKVT